MKVGSLFSCIGGIDLGFQRTGFDVRWMVEKHPFRLKILHKRFPEVSLYGDIEFVDFRKLERVDVMVGGFPCQDASIANPKGKGIEGKRTGLWKQFLRAIREQKPRYVLIENVPNLCNKGLIVVLRDLASAGYDAEWFTLQARDFGALHIRERLFIIAYSTCCGCVEDADGRFCSHTKDRSILFPWGLSGGSSDIDAGLCSFSEEQLRSGGSGFAPDVDVECGNLLSSRESDFEGASFVTDDFMQRVERFVQESLSEREDWARLASVRVVEDLFGRPDLPEPLLCGSLSGVPDGVDRIEALGEAVVPYVAEFLALELIRFDNLRKNGP
jgi:DNA (cytosine-5)-methyltransferase 1